MELTKPTDLIVRLDREIGLSPMSSPFNANEENCSLKIVAVPDAPLALINAWHEIRSSGTRFSSPYFDFEFTRMVSRVRNDVRIAYTTNGDIVEEILPFQTKGARRIVPVGGLLNDVHGVMGRSNGSSELLPKLLAQNGGNAFPFHAALPGDSTLESFHFTDIDSYNLDLTAGWTEYQRWVKRNSSTVARQGQKSRALAREIGPLRFEFDVRDPSILETLIRLKRARYQRSQTFDILSVEWAANLLREIFQCQQPGLRGVLSVLWAGDQIVALHFGMLANDILHYWFPVYDPAFARYSPGTELLLSVAEQAAKLGAIKVDLGYGDDPYKDKFANAKAPMVCGEFTNSKFAFQLARQQYFWRQRVKGIPLKPLAKKVLRSVFPGFGGWNFT